MLVRVLLMRDMLNTFVFERRNAREFNLRKFNQV